MAHERDEGEGHKMQSFSFRPMEDPNLWAIQEISEPYDKDTKVWGRVLGHMIVYVDDVHGGSQEGHRGRVEHHSKPLVYLAS